MRSIILILLILISVSLIILVLMQQRGSGAGSVFGGGGGGGEVYRARRGVEKIFHYLTVVLAFLFSAISISLIFIK